jgi:hypothetical protein
LLVEALPQCQQVAVEQAGHGMHEITLQQALQQAATTLHTNLLPRL